jgi:cell division protein FtsW
MAFFDFKRRGRTPDYVLIIAVFLLVIFGLIALASASSDLGKIRFNDTYHYFKHQIFFGLSFGLIGFLLTYYIHYKKYRRVALPIFLMSLVALCLTLFTPLGFSSGGATRWLGVGSASLQPSEIVKIAFILFLAAWLSRPGSERGKNVAGGLLPFLFLSGGAAFLLLIQPSTSAVAILLCSAFIVYFMSGAKITYIASAITVGALALALVVYVTPYRFERFASFLHPEVDTAGTGFHLSQALITIGSGGLTGVGYGKSTNKYRYLPESIGDSIFAIVAEELGFVGAVFMIGLFLVLVLRGFLVAQHMRDDFGRLLMIGFASLIGIQAFINIAAISGLMPLTGVTLPFVSYGGTSLAVFMTVSGIMANISRYAAA